MTKIEEDDTGIDSVLLTVENPVRRKIIRQLSKEPSYQLRISKELGFSQQLVAKHLDAMEDTGVVSSQMEASPHGPKRKEYLLNRSISLTIDFAPNLFRARVVEFDPLPELDLPGSSGEVFLADRACKTSPLMDPSKARSRRTVTSVRWVCTCGRRAW